MDGGIDDVGVVLRNVCKREGVWGYRHGAEKELQLHTEECA